jgi:hypothetical protein
MSAELYRKMARELICGNWRIQTGDKENFLVMVNYEGHLIHHAVVGDPDVDKVIDHFEAKILEIEHNNKGEQT